MTGGDGLPTEADCRSCHDDLIKFPFLEVTNVNKYHLLAGTPIILPMAPPGVEPGETYGCRFCHPVVSDPETHSCMVSRFKDCLFG
ncbi:MAG: hypothetical protein E4H46_04450 [Desulfobacterales bacterium]|nr:MAG: hypothetical protein E4H46_04450 [Desulfobacterales bacterium]